jgi:hypothetical protein
MPEHDGHITALHYQYAGAVDRGLYLAGASVTWQDFTEGALTAAVNAACAVVKRIGQSPAAVAAKAAGEGGVTVKDGSPLELSEELYAYRFGEEARQAVREREAKDTKATKQSAGAARAAVAAAAAVGGAGDGGYITVNGEATAKLPTDLGQFEEGDGANELRPLSIAQAVTLAREGRTEDLMDAVVQRMRGGRMRWVNALAYVDETGSMEAARRCDQARQGKAEAMCNHSSLPLFGVPIVVKDNIHVANMPSTAGTPALQVNIPSKRMLSLHTIDIFRTTATNMHPHHPSHDHRYYHHLFIPPSIITPHLHCPLHQGFIPTDTNFVVERLVRAGAIIVGKATMHELAMGISCDDTYSPAQTHATSRLNSCAERAVVGSIERPLVGQPVRNPHSYRSGATPPGANGSMPVLARGASIGAPEGTAGDSSSMTVVHTVLIMPSHALQS